MSPLHYPQQATRSFELTTLLSQINLNKSSLTQSFLLSTEMKFLPFLLKKKVKHQVEAFSSCIFMVRYFKTSIKFKTNPIQTSFHKAKVMTQAF